MRPDWKDVGIRAIKTFAQSFIGSLVTLFANGDAPGSAMTKTAIISALAAAISAVWNGVINPALGVGLNVEKPPEE